MRTQCGERVIGQVADVLDFHIDDPAAGRRRAGNPHFLASGELVRDGLVDPLGQPIAARPEISGKAIDITANARRKLIETTLDD
jgi:hypothetical protein